MELPDQARSYDHTDHKVGLNQVLAYLDFAGDLVSD
jgi:hypothetical protein